MIEMPRRNISTAELMMYKQMFAGITIEGQPVIQWLDLMEKKLRQINRKDRVCD